jgi:hypothetical protein
MTNRDPHIQKLQAFSEAVRQNFDHQINTHVTEIQLRTDTFRSRFMQRTMAEIAQPAPETLTPEKSPELLLTSPSPKANTATPCSETGNIHSSNLKARALRWRPQSRLTLNIPDLPEPPAKEIGDSRNIFKIDTSQHLPRKAPVARRGFSFWRLFDTSSHFDDKQES